MISTYKKPKLKSFQLDFASISILYFCTGFVLARAQLFNQVLPIGISFAVALFVYNKNMLGAVGAFLSYLLLADISTGTRYATCVLVLCALIYFVKASEYFATACIMSVCSVLRLISTGASVFSLAFCIAEITIAVLSVYLFKVYFEKDHPQNHVATGILVVLTAFSLTQFSLTFSLVFSTVYIVFLFKKIPHSFFISTKQKEQPETTDNSYILTEKTKTILTEISQTIIDSTNHIAPITHDDIYKVYSNTCDTLCKSCQKHDNCWISNYTYTLDCLNSATTKLVDKSHYKSTDFPLHFASKCDNFTLFLQSINSGLFDLAKNSEINKQIQENKRAISTHYNAVSAVLDDISTAINQPIDRFPNIELKLANFIKKLSSNAVILAYNNSSDLLFVEIDIPDAVSSVFDHQKLAENISEICQKQMIFVSQFPHQNNLKFLFKQVDKFNLEICTFLHSKEQKCGDIIENFTTNDGFHHVILSDGMGSGESANTESKQVVNLLSRMLKSGVSVTKSIKAISPICTMKNDALNFVALDLLTIDLNTLEASVIKYGASPTYIARDGKIYKISSKNLPLGLSTKAEISRFRLAKDDLILVSSDGLNTSNDTYIRNILRNGTPYTCSQIKEQILQNEIANPDDDKSAVVIRICTNN